MSSPAYGLHLPHFGPIATPQFMAEVAQAAESLGFRSLWLSDHVVVPVSWKTPYPYRDDGVIGLDSAQPFFDPLAVAAWLAGVTSRPEIGIGALVAPYRPPLVTAKLIGTLDCLAGGRTRMVIGSGWLAEEFQALGVPFARRGQLTDHTLRILTAAFAAHPLHLPGGAVGMEPRPLRQPYPLIVGGHSRVAMRRALSLGHGWQGTPQHPSEVPALVRALAAEAGGEIPEGFTVSLRIHLSRFDPDGPAAAVVERVRAALHPRVDEVVLSMVDSEPKRYVRRLEALAGWLGIAADLGGA
ncbi:MAG: F420-dependent oxidoreductase [Acidimicrobiia bacterium]|nr:MAG: F420-dependent oxidoreductase [Acidimicrobiia bacterium]